MRVGVIGTSYGFASNFFGTFTATLRPHMTAASNDTAVAMEVKRILRAAQASRIKESKEARILFNCTDSGRQGSS